LAKAILDTVIIIEWLRGHEPFVTTIARLLDEHVELFWTPVSVAEVYSGVRRGEEVQAGYLFLLLEPVAISTETGKKAGEYLRAYAKSHAVEIADALVAACAFVEGIPLWTLNRKHYPMKDVSFFSPRLHIP
jgi:predicted nucleic acid-binding protein